MKQTEIDQGERPWATTEEREELRRLRREMKVLHLEKEILKHDFMALAGPRRHGKVDVA